MSKEITPQESAELVDSVDVGAAEKQDATMYQILQTAVQAGTDPEKILAMMERIDDKRAEKEYWSAFHLARSEMPSIGARGENKETRSKYAIMEDIQRDIVPVYSKHGFSMSFWSEHSTAEGWLTVRTIVAHIGGHTMPYSTDVPLDLTGPKGTQNKSKTHASGSSETYGMRRLTEKVWNLQITKNPYDDDGNAASGVELITDEEAMNLQALFEEVGGDKKKFLQPYGCADFDTMPRVYFARAIKRLEAKRKQ